MFSGTQSSSDALVRSLLCLSVLVFLSPLLLAEGGGNLNPGLSADPEAIERFQDLRVGLSIHWGPSCQIGYEISWSRGLHPRHEKLKYIDPKEYDVLYKTFNPVNFDADEWAGLAKRWGMRYLIPTGKHHAGFALWHSEVSDYDMTATPYQQDVMKKLGDACRKEGIVFGSYYSNLDWYHPDWEPYEPEPGPMFPKLPDSPNIRRYLEYMITQCTELVRDYGIEILQLDGEWPDTWTHEIGGEAYRRLREVSPTLLISSRVDKERIDNRGAHDRGWNRKVYAGDYQERERMVDWVAIPGEEVTYWADYPWQAWVTIDRKQWAWNPEPNLMTANEIILDMIRTVTNNGNYLINLGPRPDGTFHPDQIAILDKVGAWLSENGEAIYGTRGGPYRPSSWGASTHKGKKVYLHVLKWTDDKLRLPLLEQKVLTARVKDQALALRQTESAVEISVPENLRTAPVTMVALEFDATVNSPTDRP